MFKLACFALCTIATAISAAPVPKELADPKAVDLPPKSSLVFVQGKWQIHRAEEPLPRRAEDKAERFILRYYLGPLGSNRGRLIYKAECDTFIEMKPKWVLDDRSVLFTSRDAYA